MALIKLGPILGGISGTIGSINFASSSKQIIARPARRPTNTTASTLQISRARLAYANQLWTAQTAATKAAYSTLAATLRRPDALAQTRAPTGREFFLEYTLGLLAASLTPVPANVPTPTNARYWTNLTLTISGAETANFTVTTSPALLVVPLLLYAQTFYRPTPQLTQTTGENVTGYLPRKWKIIKFVTALDGTAQNLYPQALPILGQIQPGQRIALLARFITVGSYSTATRTAIATR